MSPDVSDLDIERDLAVPTSVPRKKRMMLTVLTGVSAGKVFALDDSDVFWFGRGLTVDLAFEDVGVSREHARLTRREDGRWVFEDLGSTNGSFVGGELVVVPVELRAGDRIQLGPTVLLRFAVVDDTEIELLRRLYESSTRDALTGLYNRQHFQERLLTEVAYAKRHSAELALLMLDIDRFRRINDEHGHLIGDLILRAVCTQIVRVVRTEDLVVRWGGEEIVVLARATRKNAAGRLADRIRGSIGGLAVHSAQVREPLSVTVSIGVAVQSELRPGASEDELVKLADQRLRQAKDAGRNRVVLETP